MNWVLVSVNGYIQKQNKRAMVKYLFCFLIQSWMFKVTVLLRFKDASSLTDDKLLSVSSQILKILYWVNENASFAFQDFTTEMNHRVSYLLFQSL